jgi:hypothetical protein
MERIDYGARFSYYANPSHTLGGRPQRAVGVAGGGSSTRTSTSTTARDDFSLLALNPHCSVLGLQPQVMS